MTSVCVNLAVKMGLARMDSVQDFSLDGEIFHSQVPAYKTMPRLTEKEVKIVITEPEAPITLQRYMVFYMRNSIIKF
jgi:hypothetical protein